jgi:hypothetical protein
MRLLPRWSVFSLFVLTLCCTTSASGASIAELRASGHLQFDSYLNPEKNIVPGQRVGLTLEIATDTWFTGGTRIDIPEVPGLVILQTEQFASNASEIRSGQTWVIQRWTLDVYPQRAGDFTVESISLQVQVNAGEAGEVQGELYSSPLHFSATVPESLSTAEQWVAATAFTVSQSFDRELDGLIVGDAFEQEILFEASDVLAMMLPTYDAEHQTGLAAYPSPPLLDNKTNRGQSRATRSVRISYVVERPGKYVLGARDYFWWNTTSGELELLSLPETRISVAGSIGSTTADSPGPSFSSRQILALTACFLALVTAGRLAYLYVPRLPWAQGSAFLASLARRWRLLRKPALAAQLNPGSSAED